MSNFALWSEHATELGLSENEKRGLLFLSGAIGSISKGGISMNQSANWLFPKDMGFNLENLERECGNIYDGKITQLLEEALFHLEAKIDFRKIDLGFAEIQALTPKNHGILDVGISSGGRMAFVSKICHDFLTKLGEILGESEFSPRQCLLAGMFYFQINVRSDLRGFASTFSFLGSNMTPAYRYLMDMPAIGDRSQLEMFIPFQMVLYGFLSGMPESVVTPVWFIQSVLFYKDDAHGDLSIQFLGPLDFIKKASSAINFSMLEHGDIVHRLDPRIMLSGSFNLAPARVITFNFLAEIVLSEWGYNCSSFEESCVIDKLQINVCLLYALAAIVVNCKKSQGTA